MRALHLDMETRSACDLRKAGVYKYAEHPTTSLWLFSYRFDDGPVRRWRRGDLLPGDVIVHIRQGGKFVGHNVAFERIVWNTVVRREHPDAPEIKREQCDCTMVRAHAVGLPPQLGVLGQALGTATQKDTEGASLMMRMARPRRIVSVDDDDYMAIHEKALSDPHTYTFDTGNPTAIAPPICVWWNDPDKLNRLHDYCDDDVRTECDADVMIPALSGSEYRLWMLTEEMNDRGIKIDHEMVERAMAVADVAKKRLNLKMARVTDGAVKTCTNAKALVEWLQSRSIACESVAKGEMEELDIQIAGVLDDVAAEALEIRRAGMRSSTTKLKAMLACECADGRARGQIQHHGANTGRAAGRLIQPQNLFRIDQERDLPTVTAVYDALEQFAAPEEAHDVIEMTFGDVLLSLAKSLRGMFRAEPNHDLLVGDLSNIEGRGNAWAAGENWKLQAFRDYDAGTGPDLYLLAYAKSFGIEVADVKKWMRQIGKVQELALGYQGSVGAFINMAANYGLKPQELADAVHRSVDLAQWLTVSRGYEAACKAGRGYGLTEYQWTGLKIIVDGFREANPEIVQGWWDAQDAAIEATAAPGTIAPCYHGRVKYLHSKGFLWCQLPSGRLLGYANARMVETRELVPATHDREAYHRTKRSVHFERYHQKKWITSSLYGGLQCNNIVQGLARDILKDGQLRLADAGYPLNLEVHDENVSEVPVGFGSEAEYVALMSKREAWYADLPLAVKAGRDRRYVK
jgi:DNA polymerase